MFHRWSRPGLRFERQRHPVDRADRRAHRNAEPEIRERAVRHGVDRGRDRLADPERNEVEVQPAVGAFGLVEDAVAAADDHVVAERPPREAQPRPHLLHVVLGDVQRHARLAARLNRDRRTACSRHPRAAAR